LAARNTVLKHGYEESVDLLGKKLSDITDLDELCRRTGGRLESQGSGKAVIIKYLDSEYRVKLPEIVFSFTDRADEVPLKSKVLILHYLTTALGTPLQHRQITFRDVPDGGNYYDVFFKRAIRPVINRFGENAAGLLDAAAVLNGRIEEGMGDAAVTIDAFPRVPVTFILWQGDDEFPADGSVLLDASVSDYLSSYAITELCEIIAWTLVRSAGSK
jgi:Domain of unknown function (DUF3786)